MKKIYMSMVAAAVLSTGAYAESNSIKEAFANGKVSGDISIYTEMTDHNKNTDDNGNTLHNNDNTGFTNSSIGILYETDSFNGFKAAIGGRTNHKFAELNEGDYEGSYSADDSEAVLSTANISYTADMGSLIVGRQAIDLEWIGDYHEAVVGVITAVPDTTIVLGHTTRFMEANTDTNLGKMADIGDGGASVIDVKYAGIENTVINPYYMTASMYDDEDFNAYGLKATTTVANIDLIAHYAATNEDKSGQDDGSIANFEIGTTIENISLAAGYIMTDKDGGIGSISSLGDNIDPSENLGNIYGTDADTFYANISAEINIFTLGAQYATVNYDDSANGNSDDAKDSEILLTAGVAITDELSFDALYSSVDAENSDDDKDKVLAMLTYSF